MPLGEDLDRSGDVHLFLLHDEGDAGVGGIVRPEDRLALVGLVDLVGLADGQDPHRLARLLVHESDVLAFLEALRLPLGRGERDGDRPEDAVRHLVVVADALPVVLPNEAVEGREGADAHHDEVGRFAGRHLDLGERLGPLPLPPSARRPRGAGA